MQQSVFFPRKLCKKKKNKQAQQNLKKNKLTLKNPHKQKQNFTCNLIHFFNKHKTTNLVTEKWETNLLYQTTNGLYFSLEIKK